MSDALDHPGAVTAARADLPPPPWDAAATLKPQAKTLAGGGPGGDHGLPPLELANDDALRAELTVGGLLGEGGMGRVLAVRQRSLEREIAMKVLKPSASASAAAALVAEARITGHLEHPSVVPIHALGRDASGSPVLLMKRIEGVVWTELLARPEHPAWARMSWASADRRTAHLEVLIAVCNAVHFAHSRGVVHRDLKPDNVMLGEFGEVYVTDWGVALTLAEAAQQAREVVGTPAYMAPEMARAQLDRIDARTDVYLLGAVLHQILTGTVRNHGATLAMTLLSAADPRPVSYRADVPDELAAIANRATAADPAQRFPSALALQRAVADHLRHLGSTSLAAATSKKLEQLRACVQGHAGEVGIVERLGIECRFGFHEALRTWPENPAALAGLEACLELLTRERIARGDAAGARAMLAELRAPDAALDAAVAELERAQAAKQQQVKALEAMARDLDPRIGSRVRVVFLAAVAAGLFAVPRVFGMASADRLVWTPLAFAGLMVLLLTFGRRLVATAFNRRVVATVLVGFLMIFAHRVVASRSGDALGAVLRGDLLILGTLMLGVGVTQLRGMLAAAVPFLVAAAALPADEPGQLLAYTVATVAGMVVAVAASVFTERRA